jgi:hypothetical protein
MVKMSDDQGKPYQHARFRPGLNVYIDPAIREVHPLSPVAGQIVRTCTDIEFPLLTEIEGPMTGVPVEFNGEVYCVEEEYVRID